MQIEKKLVQWYLSHKRDLPFRINQDPYRVWISEIMAQQTQIDTLIPYYERWMNQYPTLDELSLAEDEELYRLWEGLGYYSRVKNIKIYFVIIAKKKQQEPKHMKITTLTLVLLIGIFLNALTLNAQVKINGKVLNSKNESIGSATISLASEPSAIAA